MFHIFKSVLITISMYMTFLCFTLLIDVKFVRAQQVQNNVTTQQPAEVGLWATKDNDGVFYIYSCGDKLCGRFVGMQYTTPLPPNTKYGRSQCNFLMLRDFTLDKSGKKWSGRIFDPRNEKGYDAKIWLSSNDELRLRGYLGITLLGETHIWHRFKGHILEKCRLPIG